MEANNDFSRSLSLLRKEKGVSQRAAAKELGISQALLSHYENGVREPGLAFVRRACDYYRVSADFLLGRALTRDGTTIGAEELYDASAEKDNVMRGSIAATLNKKLVVNSVGVLFDLLGKAGNRNAIQAASDHFSAVIYKLFRHLCRAGGATEDFFSVKPGDFIAGGATADMLYSEADYVGALAELAKEKGKEAFPPMNNDALKDAFPQAHQSFLQLIHNTDERINFNLEKRWKGKK